MLRALALVQDRPERSVLPVARPVVDGLSTERYNFPAPVPMLWDQHVRQ
jgi:hypothetical protein